MARGPTKTEITKANYAGLRRLRAKLAKAGITATYNRKTKFLDIANSNVVVAGYRLLRASNGEAALYPKVRFAEARGDITTYEGWDAFSKIERRG